MLANSHKCPVAKPAAASLSPAVNAVSAICHELARLGFDPPQRFGHGQNVLNGASLPVSVAQTLDDMSVRVEFLGSIRSLLENDLPVCLLPQHFPSGVSSIESWQAFCALIRDGLRRHNVPTTNIGFCLHSHRMPLEAYSVVADSMLGCGARYVYLDSLQMSPHCDARVEQRATANWKFLWRQRSVARPMLPVYGGLVRSACSLLGDEVATGVIPPVALHAPAGTAWISVGMPLSRFCTAGGKFERGRLMHGLRRAVDLGDRLFELVEWPTASQTADARANRRLAIVVTGCGDLLLGTGRAPQTLAALDWLSDLIRCIRAELTARSAQLAGSSEVLPALQGVCPVSNWNAGGHRDGWQQRWQIALRETAVRHRNLLVMSPASVLPHGLLNSANFADLLPVLAYADAWSFACPAKMPGWTVTQFRDFHRRARATIQGSQRASFVAAEV